MNSFSNGTEGRSTNANVILQIVRPEIVGTGLFDKPQNGSIIRIPIKQITRPI